MGPIVATILVSWGFQEPLVDGSEDAGVDAMLDRELVCMLMLMRAICACWWDWNPFWVSLVNAFLLEETSLEAWRNMVKGFGRRKGASL